MVPADTSSLDPLESETEMRIVQSGLMSWSVEALLKKNAIVAAWNLSGRPHFCFEDEDLAGERRLTLEAARNWCQGSGADSAAAQIVTLDDRYYIPGMSGQKGVVAIVSIPRGTVVAEYRGLVVTDGEFDLFEGTEEEERADMYALETDSGVKVCGHAQPEQLAIYINDWRPHPFQGRRTNYNRGHRHKKNVNIESVLEHGFPRMLIVAHRDIKAGEPLLTDYGNGYFYYMASKRDKKQRKSASADLEKSR